MFYQNKKQETTGNWPSYPVLEGRTVRTDRNFSSVVWTSDDLGAFGVMLRRHIAEDRGYILDVDLDFFSTRNPFKRLYANAHLYERLKPLYAFEPPSSIDGQLKPVGSSLGGNTKPRKRLSVITLTDHSTSRQCSSTNDDDC
ncbi:hypothetical protein AAG570_013542 [Ranatra chinensis]|uniref:Uncharacterized protein n=1 Tax=Ranatra chinensis TaxID=642074 RepID=A0ABD0YCH8_9HEMI